ncbi:MAG: hybrid sensor histidine kinase/response regulator [Chloroflexi bacterium]|nr:hybrid sensor histidine kinase/response regulator [Chloroflexota bacterium]
MATVLVVDDRPVDRQLLVTLLGYAGHRVLEAGDGAAALGLVREEHPDLVICDVLMPAIDGYELVRQLRADPATARTAVVFYSATYDEREARALARACGVHRFLIKPVEPEVILRTVDEALVAAAAAKFEPLPVEFERDHLRLLSDKLTQNVRALEAANARLAAVIDLGLHLASEPDPPWIVKRCCQAARDLLDAEHSAIGILDDDRQTLRHFISSGPDHAAGGRAGPVRGDQGVLGMVLAQRRALRFHGQDARSEVLGLPAAQPPTSSFLGVPVASPTFVYGWLYVTGKVGAEAFSADDVDLAEMIAGQLAVAYENARRYEVIQRYAQEQEQRVAEAQTAARLRDEFLSTAAHELKTPITSLRGFAQLLLRRLARGQGLAPHMLSEALRTIDEQSGKLSRLVSQLLDVSRLTAGRLELDRELTDLTAIVAGVAAAARARTTRHAVEVVAPPTARAWVDPLRLEQVVTNPIDNAIKFSPDGGLIRVEISMVDVPGERPLVRLAVRDHGIGIPPDHRQHIFDRFYQAHAGDHRSGMELGLYISRNIVERHGGQLQVEHPPDGGTRFVVILPAELGEDPAHAASAPG